MNKNINLSYIIDYEIGDVSVKTSYIDYLSKISGKKNFYIIDLSYFLFCRSKKNYLKNKKYKKFFFQPKNFFELFQFFKNKKIYAVGPMYRTLNSLYIHLLLRIFCVKLIYINFWGFYLNVGMSKKKIEENIYSKFIYFINIKLYYYFYRVFSVLGILPKITFNFETSSKRIDDLKKSFGFKFSQKFNSEIFKYYLNIKRINSIFYDRIYLSNKKKLEKNFIVVVDSGYIDHPDFDLRTHLSSQQKKVIRKIHYDRLFSILDTIKYKSKKKVIFCKHPKTNYNNDCIKSKKQNYIFTKGKTEKYISRADMVIFTGGSSLINFAILNKKKILIILNKHANYSHHLVSSLTNQLSLKVTILKDNFNFNYKKLDHELNAKIKHYDKFISRHLIYKRNITSYSQIKLFLKSL